MTNDNSSSATRWWNKKKNQLQLCYIRKPYVTHTLWGSTSYHIIRPTRSRRCANTHKHPHRHGQTNRQKDRHFLLVIWSRKIRIICSSSFLFHLSPFEAYLSATLRTKKTHQQTKHYYLTGPWVRCRWKEVRRDWRIWIMMFVPPVYLCCCVCLCMWF
jgi:hypothetical protein